MKLLNAFSIQMLPGDATVTFKELTHAGAWGLLRNLGIDSFIGHQDTASVLSSVLELPVDMNRGFVTLSKGERAIVAQLHGGRLPEGSTTLPEGFEFKFWLVEIN